MLTPARVLPRRHWLARYCLTLARYAWSWQKQRLGAWVVTVLVVALVFSVASTVQLVVWLGSEGVSSQLHSASEMQVFLADSATQDQQDALRAKLAGITGVGRLTYRSKADAQAHAAHDPQLATLAGAGDGNPFPASYVVQMSDPAVAKRVLKAVAADPAVDPKVPASYTAAQADQLSSALNALKVGAWVVDGLALGTGAIVATALLRSEIRARRDELRILALVGVPTVVVRLPLVIQALSIGLAGSVLAVLTVGYVSHAMLPALGRSLPFLHLGDPGHVLTALSLGTLTAGCAGLIPSALLVRFPR